MSQCPALPADLTLVHLERAPSARTVAVEQARGDAAEGTLVWVEQPQQHFGRHGREWITEPEPGLHAALLLRPGLSPTECAELGPVTAVALGRAIGAVVEPMTELHYRWPNDILLDEGKTAGIWLDAAGTAERVEWLVVSWAINTASAPESLGFDAAALEREGASGPVDHGQLLQSIARQLIAAVSTWDESGFGPILQSWRGRLRTGSRVRLLAADRKEITGVADSIDDHGSLCVRTDHTTESITLNHFFGIPGEQP